MGDFQVFLRNYSLMLRLEKFKVMMLMSSFISLVFCSSKRFFFALKNTWPAKYRHPVNKVTFCVPFWVHIDRVWLYREVSMGNSMISGDISKFLSVISRAIRGVKFVTILKYHEWYLCQISCTNHMLLFVYTNTCKGFVIFTSGIYAKYHVQITCYYLFILIPAKVL